MIGLVVIVIFVLRAARREREGGGEREREREREPTARRCCIRVAGSEVCVCRLRHVTRRCLVLLRVARCVSL